jgi:mannose-6-phosphate isomerase-like protein (cupin superfamily)
MTPAITAGPGIPPERTASGAAIRTLLDTSGVAGRLVRRLVDVPPGAAHQGTAGPAELWFVISGRGELELGGPAPGTRPGRVQVRRDQGVRLPAGASYRLRAAGSEPVRLDAVTLPPGPPTAADPTVTDPTAADAVVSPVVRDLADCPAELTGDRRFRVVLGPGRGCAEATQFVGEIPPGRAPDHSHAYDEVVLVLAGTGVVHADGARHPLAPGNCVHLPPGQRHCLENTGRDTLVVLGVFHPGGSPAAKETGG